MDMLKTTLPYSVAAGTVVQLVVTNTAERSYKFISSNAYAASVLQNGKVIANSPGFARIEIFDGKEKVSGVSIDIAPGKHALPLLLNRYNRIDAPAGKLIPVNSRFLEAKQGMPVYAVISAANAFYKLSEFAAKDGICVKIKNAYRSVGEQLRIVKSYEKRDGIEAAARRCAPAGFSEHHSGLAFDVGGGRLNRGGMIMDRPLVYRYIADRCHEFGFMVKNPPGKESITGTMYEPWHIRYLGKGQLRVAKHLQEEQMTLDEYIDQHVPVSREILIEVGHL